VEVDDYFDGCDGYDYDNCGYDCGYDSDNYHYHTTNVVVATNQNIPGSINYHQAKLPY